MASFIVSRELLGAIPASFYSYFKGNRPTKIVWCHCNQKNKFLYGLKPVLNKTGAKLKLIMAKNNDGKCSTACEKIVSGAGKGEVGC